MSRNEDLRTQMTDDLHDQIGKEYGDIIPALVEFLVENLFNFAPPTFPVEKADSIIVAAFGWRRRPNGNLDPGPINDELARLTAKLHEKNRQAVIYAQHEVGNQLVGELGDQVRVINPHVDRMTLVDYLSTHGVLTKAAELAGGVNQLGESVLLGHVLHLPRVWRIGRDIGINCYLPKLESLPTEFDDHPENQPWCRRALAFIVHSLISDLTFFREKTLGVDAPSTRID